MAERPVFLYVGVYDSAADAEADYEAIHRLHRAHVLGTYDVAMITRDAKGAVKVHKHEKPTQHGAWLGLAAGAVVGVFFPATLVGAAIWAGSGAAVGGVVGHFSRGLSRSDLKDVGEVLDASEVALVLIARDKVDEDLGKLLTRATRRIDRVLQVNERELQHEIDRAFDEESRA